MNTILLLSVLLFSTCSKEEDSSPTNDDPQLIGIWLSNEYIPSFLFGYEQGFELLENSIYYTIATPHPAAPIDTTFTIIDGAGGKWFLNNNKDFIIFSNETLNDSISYRIEALTGDSLILFGRSLAHTENKEHLFLKKKVNTLSVIQTNTFGSNVTISGNWLNVINRADVIKTIIIHDMSGKLIQKAADLSANNFELNVPKPGMYLISVVLSNGERTQMKYIKLE